MAKKVVIGMSGGVDSSVAAYILKKQGYDVIGLFMNNWKETDEYGVCTATDDYNDVRKVCSHLDIPYYSIDFSKEYYDKVFQHFVDEYKKGRTPNPDVLCNKEIKFDVFFKFALKLGADYVATGHYADILEKDGKKYLIRAVDENKDQTYFLNQLSSDQIQKVIFPIANIDKTTVRNIAREVGISTAEKKDSTGICFIGERHFREFLAQYIPMQDGDILTMDGEKVGRHNGVFFYTIGQRKGLGIGGRGTGEPWFVCDKDVKNNILYVVQGEHPLLYHNTLECNKFNFINGNEREEFECLARIRHRQPLQKATCFVDKKRGKVTLRFLEKQRGMAAGQYAVIYAGRICLGGGVIDDIYNEENSI